jgi:hypothetical protein
MPERESETESIDGGSASPVMTFRFTRNWTAVAFFGLLGALHLTMAALAVMAYRWEAYMSVAFGTFFVTIAVGCALVRHEVTVRADRRRVTVRTGLGRANFEHVIPFAAVTSVRVVLLGRDPRESSVSIVCHTDEVELPPSCTPRQQALLLAMAIGVRLVKVYGDAPPPEPAQRIAQLYRNEDAV